MSETLELIDELREEIQQLERDVAVFETNLKTAKQMLHETKNSLNSKRAKLDRAEAQHKWETGQINPKVSDHAVVRYMDRVLGLDVEKLREQMLTEKHKEMIRFAKDCRIKFNGVELIVKNYVVTTVLTESEA